ncbi:MAG: putative MPP superfamily phosphohydrolase [Pseudohongiellaceae bacterium]|jgi:predicted MPP superfamily phosphohydrolase
MLQILCFCLMGFLNTVLALGVLLFGASANQRVLPGLGLGRLLSTAGVVLLATAIEAGVLSLWFLDAFGVLQLLWIDVSVVVPACGLMLLLTHGRELRATMAARSVALLSLAMLPIAIHARWIEPYDLRVERVAVELPSTAAGQESIRVGVLADLEAVAVGDHERSAVTKVMAEHPDLILVAGDVFQSGAKQGTAPIAEMRDLFDRLWAPGGVWVVPGEPAEAELLREVVRGTHVRLLEDETVTIQLGDRQLTLLGLGESEESSRALLDFEDRPGDDDIRLVLCHMPRAVMDLRRDSRVDLVVAGHTHGGQVVLPLIGPPIVLSPLPRSIAAGGLHDYRGNGVYVSRGLGIERQQAPQIRFFCPPEVSLLTLQ